jgi:hypothetical protein
MKFLGAITGFIIVGVIAFLLWPRVKPTALPPPGDPGLSGLEGSGGLPPKPGQAMDPILSEEDRLKQEIATKRIPFFRFLHDNFGAIIENFGVTEAPGTLDVVVAKEDDETLLTVLQQAVGPTARQYGFNKVRFFGHRQDPLKPLALVAESTLDGSNNWTTFRK